MPTYTIELNADKLKVLSDFCTKNDFVSNPPKMYQSLNFKKTGCVITAYTSGKVVFQGNNSEYFFSLFNENSEEEYYSHFGSDEAGKGDFFGPLVITCCYIDEKNFKIFKNSGFRESKGTKPEQIKKWASQLKTFIPYKTVKIYPEKYNELYSKFNNLNKLLTWAHQTAAKNLIEETGHTDVVIIDQYAKNLKFNLPNEIRLETHAEKHPAVCAASIIAKAETLYWFDKKSKEIGFKIPLGATNVKGAASNILEVKGKDFLDTLVKKHFKTYNEVVSTGNLFS